MTVVITFGDIIMLIALGLLAIIFLWAVIASFITEFLHKKNILKDCSECCYFHLDNVNSCGDCWHTCKKGHFKNAKSEIGQIHYIRHCRDFEKDSREE